VDVVSYPGDTRRTNTRRFSLTFKTRKKLDLTAWPAFTRQPIDAVALQSCNRMSRRMTATPFFHIPVVVADTDKKNVPGETHNRRLRVYRRRLL